MSPAERSSIDRQVDTELVKETGRKTKLDWNHPKDRPDARSWLRIRDFAVLRACLSRQKMQRAQDRIAHEKYVSDSVTYDQNHLKQAAEEGGLPEAEHESAGFIATQVVHIAVEALHGAGEAGLWEVIAPAAPEVAGAAATVAAGALTLAAGMLEIGESRASGRNVSERNCFRYGFAAVLHAMANGGDWSPADSMGTIEGQMQFRGRNAAVRMVKEMGPTIGTRFLARYTGPSGKDVAVRDLGGYETKLR